MVIDQAVLEAPSADVTVTLAYRATMPTWLEFSHPVIGASS